VKKTAAAAAALVAALAPAAVCAQESTAFATLENGTSLGFSLVRTGERGPAGAIGEVVLPRSNTVSRVLWDRESGAYFGYRVDVERREGARPFRVALKPLDGGAVERELKQRGGCPGCPAPAPLGAGPQFPAAQQLAEGEALTLELLTNPTTGERILDVVKLSAQPISKEVMQAAAARALEGQRAIRRAATFFARSQFSAAAEEYRKALEVQPNDATVHNTIGMCYQYMGNDAMARRHYDRALELRPSYAHVWNNIGTLEQSRRRFKEAVRAYKKSIALKRDLAGTWKNLGNAYLALDEIAPAIESYQEALRLDPTIIAPPGGPAIPAAGVDAATQNYYLAKLLAHNGQKDQAIDMLRKARDAGFHDFSRVASDPDFKHVVSDPRYKELVAGR
jgi:tetratricopeptide (TPR) repeat protein